MIAFSVELTKAIVIIVAIRQCVVWSPTYGSKGITQQTLIVNFLAKNDVTPSEIAFYLGEAKKKTQTVKVKPTASFSCGNSYL